MIKPEWHRIAGMHFKDNGDLAVVWMAHDRTSDVLHLFDACLMKREVLAVIAEGLNARGRLIPIAWTDAAFSTKLQDRGCNMLPDASDDSDAMAEVISRDIQGRMRSGRFKVDSRLHEWLDEFKTFQRQESKVPRGTHPLMAATRYAIDQLSYARAEKSPTSKKLYPKVAIV